MDEKRRKSLFIALGFFAYLLALAMFFDQAIALMKTGSFWLSFALYSLYNPNYILVMYLVYKYNFMMPVAKWRKVLGGFLLIVGTDIPAMPRLSIIDPLTDGGATTSNLGSIIMLNLDKVFPHTLSWWLTYTIVPLALFILAMELFGIVDFIKKVKNDIKGAN